MRYRRRGGRGRETLAEQVTGLASRRLGFPLRSPLGLGGDGVKMVWTDAARLDESARLARFAPLPYNAAGKIVKQQLINPQPNDATEGT
jgi:hypothetical protein